jgi:hypothetical protein
MGKGKVRQKIRVHSTFQMAFSSDFILFNPHHPYQSVEPFDLIMQKQHMHEKTKNRGAP